jgi:hypothetical protein
MSWPVAALLIVGVWGTAFEIRSLAKQLLQIEGLLREIRSGIQRIEDSAIGSERAGLYSDVQALRQKFVTDSGLLFNAAGDVDE